MTLDPNYYKNGITNLYPDYSVELVTSSSGYLFSATATVTVGGAVVARSHNKGSAFHAYKALFFSLTEGHEGVIPQHTTAQAAALTGIPNGTPIIDKTKGILQTCIDGSFQGADSTPTTYKVCTRGYYNPGSDTKRYFPMSGTTSDSTSKISSNLFLPVGNGRLFRVSMLVDETLTGAVLTLENGSGILGTKTIDIVADAPLEIDFTTGLDSGTNEFVQADSTYIGYYHADQGGADIHFTAVFEYDI